MTHCTCRQQSVTLRVDTLNADEPVPTYWDTSGPPPRTDHHRYPYILNEPDACTRDGDDVRLVVVVAGRVNGWALRSAIRNTWGTYAKKKGYGVRVIFLVGVGAQSATKQRLHSESQTFRDIVQVDFRDSYRNLTIKSVAILKWLATYCANAKYAMKADDDLFVNIPNLFEALGKVTKSRFIMGSGILHMPVIRDKKSKWYVSHAEYTAQRYPDYCSGTGYVFPTPVAAELFRAATRTPQFWLEDVFVTGMLRRARAIDVVPNRHFERNGHDRTPMCHFRHPLITAHEISPRRMEDIWRHVQRPMNNCSPVTA